MPVETHNAESCRAGQRQPSGTDVPKPTSYGGNSLPCGWSGSGTLGGPFVTDRNPGSLRAATVSGFAGRRPGRPRIGERDPGA